MAEVQRANVVETENVIGMAMRNENRVEMFQPDSQSLLAKIAGSVNDNCLARMLNQDRDA
jgi:hypothetical protein